MTLSVERLSSILRGKSKVEDDLRSSLITALVLDVLENQEQLYSATPGCLAGICSNIEQVGEDFREQLLELIKGAEKGKKKMAASHPAFPTADKLLQQLPPDMVEEVKGWVEQVSFDESLSAVVTALFMMVPAKFRPQVAEAMKAGVPFEQVVSKVKGMAGDLVSTNDPEIVKKLFQEHYLKLFLGTKDIGFKISIAAEIVSKCPLPTDHPQAGIVQVFAKSNTKHVVKAPLTLIDQLADCLLSAEQNEERIGSLVFQILDLRPKAVASLAGLSRRESVAVIRRCASKIPDLIREEFLEKFPAVVRANKEVTVDEMLTAVDPAISAPVRKCFSTFEAAPRQFHSRIIHLFLFFPPELHPELHDKIAKGLEVAAESGRLPDPISELRDRQEELRELFVEHFYRLFKTTADKRILKAFARIVNRYGGILGIDRKAPIMQLGASHLESATSYLGFEKIDALLEQFVDDIRLPLLRDFEKFGSSSRFSRGKLLAFLLYVPPELRKEAVEMLKKSYGLHQFYRESLDSDEKIETCALYFISLLNSTGNKKVLKNLVQSAFEFIEFARLKDEHPLCFAAALALSSAE